MILTDLLKPEAAERSNGQQPSVESPSNKVGAGIVPASDPPVDAGPNRRKTKHLCKVAVIVKNIRQFFPCVIAGISRYGFIDKKSTWNRRIAACMQKQLQTDKKFSVCKTAFNIVRSVSAPFRPSSSAGSKPETKSSFTNASFSNGGLKLQSFNTQAGRRASGISEAAAFALTSAPYAISFSASAMTARHSDSVDNSESVLRRSNKA